MRLTSASRTRSSSATKDGPWWPERGTPGSDHMDRGKAVMVADVTRGASDIRPRPVRRRRRQADAGLIVRSWSASHWASNRAAGRQCRVATRRPARGRECRASPPDDAPAHRVSCEAKDHGRSNAGSSRQHGCGLRASYRGGGRDRSSRPRRVPGRAEARAEALANRGDGPAGLCLRATLCG